MHRIFTGERGYVHALIDAFGESATVRRLVEGASSSPRYEEETGRFVWTSGVEREGASRVTGGLVTTREPTLLRRREARLEGALSAVGLSGAPRAGLDRLVVGGKEYRLDAVVALRVGGEVAAYRLECARS